MFSVVKNGNYGNKVTSFSTLSIQFTLLVTVTMLLQHFVRILFGGGGGNFSILYL